MKIESVCTLAGPNVYTHRPALLMTLDLAELAGRESCQVPGFVGRLLAALPGLREHHCSRGYAGGLVERLEEGTNFGHVVEHVALELMGLAGVGDDHGQTRSAGRDGVCYVVVAYKAEQAARFLLEKAVELVESLVEGRAFAVGEKVEEARCIAASTELGPSTRAIVEAAERRGIPWRRISDDSLVQLGWGVRRKFIQAATSDLTSAVAVEIACDKDFTKQLLEDAGIAVPRGRVVRSEEEAVAAFEELCGAVVVKPLDGRQGLGVSLNLTHADEVRSAFRVAREFSRAVLVEELLAGRNYRVLVVGGRMVAASERTPCHVTGDGQHTIAELIEIENRNPLRGECHERPLTKIKVDDIVRAHLAKAGRALDFVPAAGEVVYLRESVNLSTGGTAKDVTDEVHPTIRRMCERAARAAGLDICGVDLVLEDITAEFKNGCGGIIELNAAPGLRMHLHPSEGQPRDVGGEIIRMLYPEGDGRIPVFSVTGTNGKTTVTRMIAHVLSATGRNVGMTTTDGIYVGGDRVVEGDTTGPHSARVVLSDPTVEVAVLETARGGIVRRGLGYDWSDIAVMTNIGPDHIGQDGIETVEDILWIKSLVAERVREGGTVVLNADDEQLARLTENPYVGREGRRIVYFSLRDNHLLIRRHADAGGTGYFVRNGYVVEDAAGTQRRILRLSDVPATLGGTSQYQVANVLASVAACRAHGLAVEAVAKALATFNSATHNPGRANLFRVASGGYVMLDYGHNPEAFAAVCRAATRWHGRRVTGIVAVPGDRADELIEEAGRVAARGFHSLVIREDEDLRGRRPGEVAGLLSRAARQEVPGLDCRVVLSSVEALRGELARLRAGDVVVMFYEKLEPLLTVLREFGAEPAARIEGLEVGPDVFSFSAAAGTVAAAAGSVAASSGRIAGHLSTFAAAMPRREISQDWQGYIWR
jgi:cyanophycin synthetase